MSGKSTAWTQKRADGIAESRGGRETCEKTTVSLRVKARTYAGVNGMSGAFYRLKQGGTAGFPSLCGREAFFNLRW